MPPFSRPRSFGLPLLARELTELANRRRTYVLRVLYAVLLFGLAYFWFRDILAAGGDQFAMLGQGRRMFGALVALQFFGIYLFMPLLGASAIAAEKERNSLALLFLTRLGPTTILFEKLLGRLAPMAMFLLLGMPLLGFTYSLGGVSAFELWGAILLLALTAVQVAALTLMCSAYHATTFAALISSYGLAIVSLFFCSCCGLPFELGGIHGNFPFGPNHMGELVVRTVVLTITTTVLLVLGRSYLVSRAFAAPNRELFESRRRYDRYSVRNDRKDGLWLARQTPSLPGDEPVAWRGTTKALAGLTSSLLHVLMPVSVTLWVLLGLPLLLDEDVGSLITVVLVLFWILWFVFALLLVVTTTGLFPRERNRQTLEVLLVTPLSSREIIRQKLKPIWRLLLWMWVPVGTVFLFSFLAWCVDGFPAAEAVWLAASLVAGLIYLPLIVWVSLLMSFAVKSQGRAIVLVVGLMTAWVLAPSLLLNWGRGHPFTLLNLLGMFLWIPIVSVQHRFAGTGMMIFLLLNGALFGGLLALLRRIVLARADALLGRLEEEAPSPEEPRAIVTRRVGKGLDGE